MKKLLIVIFGIIMFTGAANASDEQLLNTYLNEFTTIQLSGPKQDAPDRPGVFAAPTTMHCGHMEKVEKDLLSKNLHIVLSGLVSNAPDNESLIEIWMHKESKAFVIVKVFSSARVTCLLTFGPTMIQGGQLLHQDGESNQKPEGQQAPPPQNRMQRSPNHNSPGPNPWNSVVDRVDVHRVDIGGKHVH